MWHQVKFLRIQQDNISTSTTEDHIGSINALIQGYRLCNLLDIAVKFDLPVSIVHEKLRYYLIGSQEQLT